MIKKILKIRSIKVLLCFIESTIKRVSLKTWILLEKKLYNPYDFWEDNLSYYRNLSNTIISLSSKYNFDLTNKKLLELWPGGFLWVWSYLKKEWLVEYNVIDNINHFEKLDNKTKDLYTIIDPLVLDWDFFNKNYVKQLDYNSNKLPLDNWTIDIVFSNAVYEHIDKPESSISELSRVTKIWWIWIHTIDFRDHIFNQKWLYFLTISDTLFNFFFKKSWAWVNRKRYSDFKKYFEQNSFEILEDIRSNNFYDSDKEKHKELSEKYSELDLTTSEVTFIVKKI